MARRSFAPVWLVAALVLWLGPEAAPPAIAAGCPAGMANIEGQFCIDRYEASVDVVDAHGRTLRRHSPYQVPAGSVRLRARSRAGVVPQAHISQVDAAAACAAAGKRLCTDGEWVKACQGRTPTRYPYGPTRIPGRCNDQGTSPLRHFHGRDDSVATFGIEAMNDPRLNQVPGTLAKTGAFAGCRNSFGVHDMVGNLHEWTAASGGTFRGGYYLDVVINGEGCEYQTTAHVTSYHDYSIGFRCCQSLSGGTATRMPPRIPPSAAPPATSHPPGTRTHVVASGQTLGGIAKRYGVSIAALCAANRIERKTPIRPGQELKIPPKE